MRERKVFAQVSGTQIQVDLKPSACSSLGQRATENGARGAQRRKIACPSHASRKVSQEDASTTGLRVS